MTASILYSFLEEKSESQTRDGHAMRRKYLQQQAGKLAVEQD